MNIDFLVAFRSLNSDHIFVGVMLLLLVYFQLDLVSQFMITILLFYANSRIVITVARDLMPTFVLWRSSAASKFGLILRPKDFLFPFRKRLETYPSMVI